MGTRPRQRKNHSNIDDADLARSWNTNPRKEIINLEISLLVLRRVFAEPRSALEPLKRRPQQKKG